MIDLLPHYTHDSLKPVSQPLTAAPNFVRSRNATRWHRPRSGQVYPGNRVTYDYWCGAGTPFGLGQDEVPDEDLLCGTCEGRWSAQQDNRLVFTPISSLPPTRCPASHSNLFPQGVGRRFTCLVCGDEAKVSGGGLSRGPYVSAHKTGSRLIRPCPHHGWNRLCFNKRGRVACACTVPGGDLW